VDEMTFGRYRLLSVIGEGGMGKVYKAHDTEIGRDVAIKVLPTELGSEPGYRERFRREAHTAARLAEPHIIPIYDTGEIDGRLYLVMPVIDGIDVHGLLQRDGPMSPQRAVHVIDQLADALNAAHTVGLVHRDIKPSNALVTGHDFVYLIDFGIAHDKSATKITTTNTIVGTWAYMAPERFTTGAADARVDIYALACVLHECLTGVQPYPGDSLEQQFTGHFSLDPPRPSNLNPAVPAGFDEVIAHGMAKDPDQRYQSAHDLASAAHHALTTSPSRHPQTVIHPTQPVTAPTVLDDRLPPPPPPRPSLRSEPPRRRPQRPLPPPARPVDRPTPGTVTPPPQQVRRRRRRLAWPLTAAIAVALGVAGMTGYLLQPHSPTSQTPTAQPTLPPGQTGQPASPSPATVLPFTGLNSPDDVAVDSVGNLYVVDAGNSQVLEMAAGSSGPTVLPFTGLGNPSGVTVDAARTVYVTNVANNRVLKLTLGSSSTIELPINGLNRPHGVAVDTADNLYIAAGNRVLKLAAGSSSTTELPFTDLSNPIGVAVDGAGAVYVADTGNNRVLKLAAGSIQSLSFTGLNKPHGVAVDGAGAVYVSDTGNNRVLKLSAGSVASTVLPAGGLKDPGGVAVDTADNVYVADTGNNRVVKLAAG
jgi:serine/threonine protein kinase, bacterial